ncbi:GGDEF domain-containing protein [Rhizobium oryzicola]|uniref:diguanylate cyclase n=1 Tax=Rhizobium oryzicola TaxID=1232668 RepID=A0ABT8SWU4_9HYPH|nr:GGDEF domain-containing protein [Rhizobium oryzicola]MDO1582513.1 GGDEF domain-containing protein [Rhizobium oryzicola]
MIPTARGALRVIKTSLILKVFLVCFLAVHAPLIGLIVYLAFGLPEDPVPMVSAVVAVTVLGTVFSFAMMWMFFKPLRTLAASVRRFNVDGVPFQLPSDRSDEVGVVLRSVTCMVSDMNLLMMRLKHQALTDPLTGLGNRRWLNERVAEEIARAKRQRETISIIVFDLDNFKQINDRYGHDVGDHVLVAAGELITKHVRPYDLAARIGGEEFCVVLPRTRGADALTIAERLRACFEEAIVHPLAKGRVTASFGVYQAEPEDGLARMLTFADNALYHAKQSGRNLVLSYDPDKQMSSTGNRRD